ncbi:MAG: sulfite exporter TauE/SafE family protein [bacterium]
MQAGVGVLLIAALVGGAHYDPVAANGVKLLLTLLFTLVALPIFATNGQVDWALGGLMAAGQGAGAFLAARYATHAPRTRAHDSGAAGGGNSSPPPWSSSRGRTCHGDSPNCCKRKSSVNPLRPVQVHIRSAAFR